MKLWVIEWRRKGVRGWRAWSIAHTKASARASLRNARTHELREAEYRLTEYQRVAAKHISRDVT